MLNMEASMMSERDERLKSIRPLLGGILPVLTDVERFQTDTLRPILKFQNGIILAQFRKYLQKFKPAFNAYNQSAQKNYIEDVLKRDPRIKNSLIATAVSVMTLSEYDFYCENKAEINKRIISLLSKRLQDHLEMLY